VTERRYDLLTPEEISDGRATAAYFLRTEAVLEDAGANPDVVAELRATGSDWRLFAGLKDAARLLEGVPVDADAAPEGTVFRDAPVLRIRGPYRAFARYESPLLGFLSHASGIATNALGIRAAARDRTVLSFGTRRQHPALGAVIERSAHLGGADGIGNVAGGDLIGVEAGGTMPHALVVCLGEPEAAWAAYDAALDESIPRTLLCDTFGDEADESGRAADLLGDALDGVRLDTAASRRGDFRAIIEDVRWELERRGRGDVDVLVSGGIDRAAVRRLRDVADGFGVGSAIADADPVDFSLNVVAVDGEARAKRGVNAGAKAVYRDGYEDAVVPVGVDAPGERLLEPVVRDGTVVASFDLAAARERAADGLAAIRDRGEVDAIRRG